jgi:hypothetical protein
VNIADTSGRGGGASRHINHSRRVNVEVVFTVMEKIREANMTGGGCTSTELIAAILEVHSITIRPRTLQNVLASMGYRYGKANVIGKVNE